MGQVGQVGQGAVPAVYIGVQDKDSTHTRPSHSALITSINCFRREKCVFCSPRKGLSRTRTLCRPCNFGLDYFCLLWKTCTTHYFKCMALAIDQKDWDTITMRNVHLCTC